MEAQPLEHGGSARSPATCVGVLVVYRRLAPSLLQPFGPLLLLATFLSFKYGQNIYVRVHTRVRVRVTCSTLTPIMVYEVVKRSR